MLVKILLKIWPAITPIILYCLWVFISTIIIGKVRKCALKVVNQEEKAKNSDYIDGKYKIVGEESAKKAQFRSKLSFSNKNFLLSIYLGLIILIFTLIFGVLLEKTNFTQSNIEDLKKGIIIE